METEYLKLNGGEIDEKLLCRAAEIIKSGGLVAIPTETVYGLGASALDESAVKKIFAVKGRPQDNPLIIHVCGADELEKWCVDIPKSAYELAKRFWPGALTMVLKRSVNVPEVITAGMDSVAVRCPDHTATLRLIELAEAPIAAPSANISGKPSTTSAGHVMHDMGGKIEAVLDGGECAVGLESTIIDLTTAPPRLLRPGGVSVEKLEQILGRIAIDPAVYRKLEAGEKPKAPGMKYRHYSPRAAVTVLDGELDAVVKYVNERATEQTAVLCFDGEEKLFSVPFCLSYGKSEEPETLAKRLFASLRELDRDDIKEIYARCPPKNGVGLAVFNRLSKAAGNAVTEVR